MVETVLVHVQSPHRMIEATCMIASVGWFTSSLEWLYLCRQFGNRGLFSWQVLSATVGQRPPALKRAINGMMSPPFFGCLLTLRVIAVYCCLVLPFAHLVIPLLILLLSQLAIHYRCRYGLEGADQMTLIVLVSLLVYSLFRSEAVGSITLGFLAAQSALSYFIAGVSKLFGSRWRRGTAVRDILRTRGFGNSLAWRVLQRSTALTVIATYLVLAFECTFPLICFLPIPYSMVYIVLGCTFHLATAFTMGLNQFLWAFPSTYPALVFCSFHFSQSFWGSSLN